jgi:hypothetical protein
MAQQQFARTVLDIKVPVSTDNFGKMGAVSEILGRAKAEIEALEIEGLSVADTASIYAPNPEKGKGRKKAVANTDTVESVEAA